MGYKYCCDDCGKVLEAFDNIAEQLDLTGHAYCYKCYPKHEHEKMLTIYTNNLSNPKDKFQHSFYAIA
jgi:hypothetical protein